MASHVSKPKTPKRKVGDTRGEYKRADRAGATVRGLVTRAAREAAQIERRYRAALAEIRRRGAAKVA